MSVLTKREILARIKKEEIGFTPNLDRFQIGGHSVDLRLGYTFMIHKNWQMTKKGREMVPLSSPVENQDERNLEVIELEEGQYFELLPGESITVSPLEDIKVPQDLMATLYPRSSVSRRGISIDLTGIIDAGYEGPLIIPMKNNTMQVARLYPGERICQIVFETLTEKIENRKSRHHMKDVIDTPEKENTEEMQLIAEGKILELKEKFKEIIE